MNEEAILTRVAEPLYRAKGWIKFAGILVIIQGALAVLTIWGIIICWIPIWMGILLCSASNHISTAYETNDDTEFRTSMTKLATYFRIFGIFALVMIVISVIGILTAVLIPLMIGAQY
ncbi:MAG: DUF5362 domain-containing protein [Desulfobacteraceae bacterium]|nr:DUF5362 domain-containing protein [Desulfobacteraceae bacterium]